MIYFDTSYLAKCYLTDTGYAEVRRLATEHEVIACCEYGRVELAAALHRKLREHQMTRIQYEVIQEQFELDERKNLWRWLPIADLLKKTAEQFHRIPSSIYIRSGDAIHLTCAAENRFKEIYSSDKHLLNAATFFGIRGINIIRSSSS